MVADVGAKFPPQVFATDAQGDGQGDHGGHGVAGSYASNSDWHSVLTCGEIQGQFVSLTFKAEITKCFQI